MAPLLSLQATVLNQPVQIYWVHSNNLSVACLPARDYCPLYALTCLQRLHYLLMQDSTHIHRCVKCFSWFVKVRQVRSRNASPARMHSTSVQGCNFHLH